MSPPSENNCPITIIALPNETLCAIFNDLPPPTLATVACISHRMQALAERLLYASVSITDIVSESSPAPRKTLMWCEAMQRRAHLTEATKKLQIRWQGDPHASPPRNLSLTCAKVAEALRPLTALEALDIFLGPANFATAHDEPLNAVEQTIRGCCFPHLRTCALGADWTKGVRAYTRVLPSFLASLSALRHLRLPDRHTGLEVPADALPCLASFRGSADTAAALLPGRPVQYLSLVGQDSDVNRDNLPRMTYTSLPLRHLDLSAMSVRLLLLRNVSAYLPTVETLRIKLALRHTLHYAFSGIRLLAGLSAVLGAFHQLTYLDLSPTDVDGVGRADAAEEFALCREWSRACPSLSHVIFPSETEWILNEDSAWLLVQRQSSRVHG